MNSTQTPPASLAHMIETLNAKAAAHGCAVRAEHLEIDGSWGSREGVALVGGTDEETERAARFVRAYYDKHIGPQDCRRVQCHYKDYGVETLARFSEFRDGAWHEGEGKLVRGHYHGKRCPEVSARIIGIAYYPCAE